MHFLSFARVLSSCKEVAISLSKEEELYFSLFTFFWQGALHELFPFFGFFQQGTQSLFLCMFFDKELCMSSSPFLGFFSREHKVSFFACFLARSFVQELSLSLSLHSLQRVSVFLASAKSLCLSLFLSKD